MKFQLAVNLERMDDSIPMKDVRDHTLRMVKMADEAGFEIAWAAEHHALEMTIAPNPFSLLVWWGENTQNIRLGCAVVNASYWHPIKLAGEAAMTDLLTDGRLEFGIGSGAYQREFDRMMPGLKQSDSWKYMNEMLPAVLNLWKGDYEHNGEYWQFPLSTSVPKPVQDPHPPLWVAARSPITYDYAIQNNCNVMCWPLTRDFSEAELYKQRLDDAMQKFPNARRPEFALMRHAAVYETPASRDAAIVSIQCVLGQFENLFRNMGDVKNGFPKQIPLSELANRDEYNADMLEENLLFGSPDEVIEKLKRYEDLGVDSFIYYASMGMPLDEQIKSMELFCDKVMPAFA
ncbi:MAG: LLM class flavin-dependent oxidoreductase [Candidatus Puniceispirillales bacterium]